MREREVKLRVDADFTLPAAPAGMSFQDRGLRELDAVYWDTASLALFHTGHGLRRRTGDTETPLWTLKGPSIRDGDASSREEIEVPGGETVPESLVDRVATLRGSEPIQPVARVLTRRRVLDVLSDGRRIAELADDRVRVEDGAGRERSSFAEVEVELAEDVPAAALEPLVQALQARGAVVDATPKYARALLAVGRIGSLRG